VSRQLGHKDSSITLRVYAHWLPDTSTSKGVDRLDDALAAGSLHANSRSIEQFASPLYTALRLYLPEVNVARVSDASSVAVFCPAPIIRASPSL
jgi:hypothetical protein